MPCRPLLLLASTRAAAAPSSGPCAAGWSTGDAGGTPGYILIPWPPQPVAAQGGYPADVGAEGRWVSGVWVQEHGVPGSVPGWPEQGVSGRPSPTSRAKGQGLGMLQLFLEQQGLPEKALAGYIRVGSDSPLAGCRGLHSTCRGCLHRDTALLGRHCSCPIPLCPTDPTVAAGSPGSYNRLLLGVFAPRCWARLCHGVPGRGWTRGESTVPFPASPGSSGWGGRAGFAPGSVLPWRQAAGSEPRWKGLMRRWPRTELVNTAGAPGSAAPFSRCLSGCPDPRPARMSERMAPVEAVPPHPGPRVWA